MSRVIKKCALMGVAVLTLAACLESGSSAFARPLADSGVQVAAASAKPHRGEITENVTLHHPISLDAAVKVVEGGRGAVRQLLFDQAGTIGGLLLGTGAASKQVAALKKAYVSVVGFEPLVTGLELLDDPPSRSGSRPTLSTGGAAAIRLAASSPAVAPPSTTLIAKLPAAPRSPARVTSPGQVSPATGQVIPSHFPSTWTGLALPYGSNPAWYGTSNWFTWESSKGSSPGNVPSDWGIELGITLYNNGIGGIGVRPACLFTSQDPTKSFWAQTWNSDGAFWATTVPSVGQPYADYVLDSDPCSTNGLEFGVGNPRSLSRDVQYWMYSGTLKGTQPQHQSTMSASFSLKSNDCNDLGLTASSPCMGLNTTRNPPVAGAQLYVGKSRNWIAPGCYWMSTGWTGPIYAGPGLGGCYTTF